MQTKIKLKSNGAWECCPKKMAQKQEKSAPKIKKLLIQNVCYEWNDLEAEFFGTNKYQSKQVGPNKTKSNKMKMYGPSCSIVKKLNSYHFCILNVQIPSNDLKDFT